MFKPPTAIDVGKTLSQIFLGPSQTFENPRQEEYIERIRTVNPVIYPAVRRDPQRLVGRKCPQGYLGNCLFCSYFPCNYVKAICLDEIMKDMNKR